ncbi:MAG TPA: hypothetical protein VHS56_06385 [Candidatus Cybelea sp.]|jgi:hypothetical protein|nr:hypothetical protein [Candidatus Cybelea sp.]
MRSKRIVTIVVASAVAAALARLAISVAKDVGRYNHLREMSGEGPVWNELPAMLCEVVRREREAPLNLGEVIAGLPADLERYANIKAMSSPLYVPPRASG